MKTTAEGKKRPKGPKDSPHNDLGQGWTTNKWAGIADGRPDPGSNLSKSK